MAGTTYRSGDEGSYLPYTYVLLTAALIAEGNTQDRKEVFQE